MAQATKIPSQVGEWTITRESGRWFATHSDWERGDVGGGESGPAHAGGPVYAEGADIASMLVGLIELEAEGDDFGAFCAAVEIAASGTTTDGLEAEELTGELFRLLGYHAVDGSERVTEALEDGMLGLGRDDAQSAPLPGFTYTPEAQAEAVKTTTLPSQAGEWTVMHRPGMAIAWVAAHSELRQGTGVGGMVTAQGQTLPAMLVELVEIESHGDVMEFLAAVQRSCENLAQENDATPEELATYLLEAATGELARSSDVDEIAAAILHVLPSAMGR